MHYCVHSFFRSLWIGAIVVIALVAVSCQTDSIKPGETGTYSVTIPSIVGSIVNRIS